MKPAVSEKLQQIELFDLFPSGMLLIDSQFTVSRWNRAAARLLAREGDSLGSARIGKIINCPNHSANFQGCGFSEVCRVCGLMKAIRHAIEDNISSHRGESVVSVVIDGAPQDVCFQYGVVPVSLDGCAFALLSLEDVTERKLTEKALRESEERYRQQFHQSDAVMLIVNPVTGEIEDANAAACRFYGYDRATLLKMEIFDINTDRRDQVLMRMQDVVNGDVRRFQCCHLLADDSQRDVEVFTSPIDIGTSSFLHSIIIDISFRLAAERELRDKMDFAENLIFSSTTPTFVINSNHHVLIWNRALEEMTGVKAQEIVGTNDQWRAFYKTARPCLADIVIDGLAQQGANLYSHFTHSSFIPDGLHAEGDYIFPRRRTRLIFSAAPIRDREGRVIAAIETLEDITDRLSLESQLIHAQKMESVGVLVGGVAHDFNNVLTVINGYADLLQLTLRGDEQNLRIVREISGSVERAADMTRTLLAFSGKHEMLMQYDDLNLIVSNIRKSLGRLIREDISLEIQPGPERLPVYVDRVQIDQVLINLVVNARDAMGPGGAICVSTMLLAYDTAHQEGNTLIPPGRYACLSVSDTGSGIAAETLEHIFEPFFTTKEKGKGTGLGLAIVSNIITTKHNGHISVTSVPGSGTEFRVFLPLYAGAKPLKLEESTQLIAHHGSETVLMVEDDAAIMKLLQEVLTRYGYQVLTAADGVEAMELFTDRGDEIHIALVDVIMPRLNGREVVEKIREKRPGLPVIMLSGYTDEIIDRMKIEDLGVLFIQKPVKPLDLLAAIRRCLNRTK